MPTDWNKIREVVNTVIDSCERVEHLNQEEKRSQVLNPDNNITVSDLLASFRTYPENLNHSIIRSRHELGQSKAYTSDIAHSLINTANLCAELLEFEDFDSSIVLDGKETSVAKQLNKFVTWHKEFVPSVIDKLIDKQN